MGFITKNRMGFFLVFFPEEQHPADKKLTSSSSAKFTAINTLLRRTNSAHILTTAQSTISICAILVFITFLLFTLSTFEPNSVNSPNSPPFISRRHLFSRDIELRGLRNSYALHGMGDLYCRGSKAMSDLIVIHLGESVSGTELRLFLRVLQRSGLTSRSDVVFIFPNSHSSSFKSVIHQETDSFSKLICHYKELDTESTQPGLASVTENDTESTRSLSFDVTQFYKSTKKEKEWTEPIWGRRIQATQTNFSEEKNSTESSTRLSIGSVLSFELDELDPENSLSGFFDHIPMSLRRWACYPMLLGRFRRNFKNILLLDIKDSFIINDPLTRVRTRSPETVFLTQSKHSKKDKNSVNPGIIMGGARGVRRLATAVLTQIARAAMQQHAKKKNPVTESGILSQLVSNTNLLKNVNFVVSAESVPELMSWVNSGLGVSVGNFTVVRRGNSNSLDVQKVFMKHLCEFSVDSSVYSSEC